MTDRVDMPSALPAEYAERASDTTHCHARRPTVADYQSAAYQMREEIDAGNRKLAACRLVIEDAIRILKGAE